MSFLFVYGSGVGILHVEGRGGWTGGKGKGGKGEKGKWQVRKIEAVCKVG